MDCLECYKEAFNELEDDFNAATCLGLTLFAPFQGMNPAYGYPTPIVRRRAVINENIDSITALLNAFYQ